MASITTTERKRKVAELMEEHSDYFSTLNDKDIVYIPKMAYRPSGKDELHVSFFPSEFEKEKDIYTEFVSIAYDSEDIKRTLYLLKHNPHWKSEYEEITSNSGYVRHIVPVSELKVISDAASRNVKLSTSNIVTENLEQTLFDLKDPDVSSGYITEESLIVNKLEDINQTLITLSKIINKLNK
jgi:excinuclease UvrABC nuclease subunit